MESGKRMRCSKHPKYQGIHRQRVPCDTCHTIYLVNHGMTDSPIPKFKDTQKAMSFMDWAFKWRKRS